MNYFLALGLLAVLACLAAAGFFLLRRPTDAPADAQQQAQPHYARALKWRVVVSIVLFASVLLAWHLGYIQPHGLPLQAR